MQPIVLEVAPETILFNVWLALLSSITGDIGDRGLAPLAEGKHREIVAFAHFDQAVEAKDDDRLCRDDRVGLQPARPRGLRDTCTFAKLAGAGQTRVAWLSVGFSREDPSVRALTNHDHGKVYRPCLPARSWFDCDRAERYEEHGHTMTLAVVRKAAAAIPRI